MPDDNRPDPLPIGTRCYHAGEQWSEAIMHGTGVILDVVCYYPKDRTYEYLVQTDKPLFWAEGETKVQRNHIFAAHVQPAPTEEKA